MAHAIYAKTGRDINLSYVAPVLVSDLAPKVRDTIPATGAARLLGIDRSTLKSLEVAGLVKSVPRFGDSSPGYSRAQPQDLLARSCLIGDATLQESNLRAFDLITKARAHQIPFSAILSKMLALNLQLRCDAANKGFSSCKVSATDWEILVAQVSAAA